MAKGQGWGNGKGALKYHESRRIHISKRMATSEFTSFRPRVSNEAFYWIIRDWGSVEVPHLRQTNGHGDRSIPLSALFNSLLQGLAIAVQNTTEIDAEGNISIEVNLGRIIIE